MQTLYFQLERSKTLKDGSHPIFLVLKIHEAGKERRIRYYTGRSAKQSHWIGKGQGKKVSAKAPGATITNSRLETLRQGADSIITNAKNLRIPLTGAYFRDRFDKEVLGKVSSPENTPVKKSFFSHLSEFIENRRGVLQPATIKTYETLKTSLQEFELKSGYKVEFESINGIFHSLYTKHLIDDKKVLNNTLAKRMATLKAFLREMKSLKINTNTDYENFKASRDTETTVMYLTRSELAALEKLKLNPGTLEDHIRDAFCFAAHTGLRFSDWDKIRPENIIQDKDDQGNKVQVLKYIMHKVHRTVNVPLSLSALKIIGKYKVRKDGLPIIPLYSNQETNRTLKDLAKEAEIDEIVRDTKKSGAHRIEFSNPKYEIISCHDARNTMATLYLERGGRPEVLQRLLGHSNIKQTMRYVKIVDKAIYSDFTKTINSAKVLSMKKPA